MTTQPLPDRLELAAKIIREELPAQVLIGGAWIDCPFKAFKNNLFDRPIRIKPAELPSGMQWHNPDRLTPEQVGDGYRLCVPEELDGRHKGVAEYWYGPSWGSAGTAHLRSNGSITFRVPVTTPFPALPTPPSKVPLGPEDVPPGSYIDCPGNKCAGWNAVLTVTPDGVILASPDSSGEIKTFLATWQYLVDMDARILRPGSEWTACEKMEGGGE